jgi:hypothetical protein
MFGSGHVLFMRTDIKELNNVVPVAAAFLLCAAVRGATSPGGRGRLSASGSGRLSATSTWALGLPGNNPWGLALGSLDGWLLGFGILGFLNFGGFKDLWILDPAQRGPDFFKNHVNIMVLLFKSSL